MDQSYSLHWKNPEFQSNSTKWLLFPFHTKIFIRQAVSFVPVARRSHCFKFQRNIHPGKQLLLWTNNPELHKTWYWHDFLKRHVFWNPFFTLLVGNIIVFFSLADCSIQKRLPSTKNHVIPFVMSSNYCPGSFNITTNIYELIWNSFERKMKSNCSFSVKVLCFAASFCPLSVKMLLPLIFRESQQQFFFWLGGTKKYSHIAKYSGLFGNW